VDVVRNYVENVAGDGTGGDHGGQPVADLMSVEPVAHSSDLLAGLSIESGQGLVEVSCDVEGARVEPAVLLALQA